jgi:bifunctional DNase/RNase
MEVEMKIRGLMMDPVTNMPIVVLKDVGSDMVLPIWVGIYEANAIALEIEKVTTPRPMTHDLIKNLLIGLDTQVHKIVVTELREDTFFAVIWLERDGRIISVDSRPSDALALAVRTKAPIFAHEDVIAESAIEFEHEVEDQEEVVEKFKDFLDNVSPEDFASGS